MAYQNVVEYFPIPLMPHRRKREMFHSYGSCGAVNIEEHDIVKYFGQTVCRLTDGEYWLVARDPCSPLLPPNAYNNLLEEPCLSYLKQEKLKMQKSVQLLSEARTRTSKKSVQLMLSEVATLMSSLKDTMSNEPQKTLQDLSAEGSIIGDIRSIANQTREFLDDKLRNMSYNEQYCGGCVTYLPFCESLSANECIGVLALPTGPMLAELSFCPLNIVENSLNVVSTNCKLPVEGRIFQTNASSIHGQYIVACRHGDQCSLFEIQGDDDDDECPVIASALMNHYWKHSQTTSFVSLSPYISAECLVSCDNGTVYLWSPNCRPRQVHKADDGPRSWHSCHFSSHPRQAVNATCQSVSILDFRRSDVKALDLCNVSQSFLHPDERFSVARQHPTSPFYHFVATNATLLMLDERCANYPVLLWTHNMVTAPQYMDIATGTFRDSLDDDILLVASQDAPETHCYQFRLNQSATHKPPQAVGAHWRACMVEDMYMFMVREGRAIADTLLPTRLRAPLAGMCAVPHCTPLQSGLSIIQVTSFGDVFTQNYEVELFDHTLPQRDKTCSSGIASDTILVSSEWLNAVESWIKVANAQHVATNKRLLKRAQNTNNLDKTSLTTDVFRHRPAPHTRCHLCEDAKCYSRSYDDSERVVCPACCHSTLRSATISQLATCVHPQKDLAEERVEIFELKDKHPTAEEFSERLAAANADLFQDAESQLLVKIWNEETDLTQLLLKRDEETYGSHRQQPVEQDDDEEEDAEEDNADDISISTTGDDALSVSDLSSSDEILEIAQDIINTNLMNTHPPNKRMRHS